MNRFYDDNGHFRIRSCFRHELAEAYFPEATSQNAVRNLHRWILRNGQLRERLKAIGYLDRSRWLSRETVRLIVEYLGDP